MLSMWRLLHKNVSKQQYIRAQFILFSLLIHVVLIGPLLFIEFIPYKTYYLQANRSHIDDQAKVVLMPLVKRVNQQPVKAAISTVKKSQPVKKAKPKTTIKKEPVKRTKPQQKAQPKPKPKPQPKPQSKPKQAPKKVQQKPIAKKAVHKAPQKMVKKNTSNQTASAAAASKQPAQQSDENIRYVGREELEEIQMQEIITEKLVERWKPPVGLSKDLFCEVKMIVDAQGVVKQVCVHKASGVLIYDVSARLAAQGIELPQWARGKEFYIIFKQ